MILEDGVFSQEVICSFFFLKGGSYLLKEVVFDKKFAIS